VALLDEIASESHEEISLAIQELGSLDDYEESAAGCWLRFFHEAHRGVLVDKFRSTPVLSFDTVCALAFPLGLSDTKLVHERRGDFDHFYPGSSLYSAVDYVDAHLSGRAAYGMTGMDLPNNRGGRRRRGQAIPNRFSAAGVNAHQFYDPFSGGVYTAVGRDSNLGRPLSNEVQRGKPKKKAKEEIERFPDKQTPGMLLWSGWYSAAARDPGTDFFLYSTLFYQTGMAGLDSFSRGAPPVPEVGTYRLLKVFLDIDPEKNPRIDVELEASLTQAVTFAEIGGRISGLAGCQKIYREKKYEFPLRPGDKRFSYEKDKSLGIIVQCNAQPVNVFARPTSVDNPDLIMQTDNITDMQIFRIRIGAMIVQISDRAF
jgi:hypothetical protein